MTPARLPPRDVDLKRDNVRPADGPSLTDSVVGHITDQARRTASAARAARVVNAGGEPGVLDLTPLRELLSPSWWRSFRR